MDARTPKIPSKVRAEARLAWHDAALNVEQAAGLLQVSTAWIRRLTHEGVLSKVDGRYRLVDTVQAYLRYVKDEQRLTGRAQAVTRVAEARAAEIEARTAQRLGRLMPTERCIEVVDELCGVVLTELSAMSARSRDPKVRQVIAQAVHEAQGKIAATARAKAQELKA
jgi:hypothetical protein